MPLPVVSIWKKVPFLRLLIPFAAGLVIQWYLQFSLFLWQFTFAISFISFLSFFFFPFFSRYKFSSWNGLSASVIFIAAGALLTRHADIRNHTNWFGHFYERENSIIVTLDEIPVKKAR